MSPRSFFFEATLWVPRPVEEVFPFFADPRNLETITPSWLNFKLLTPLPVEMRVGALIDYRLRLHGIPISWQTEITQWEPPLRFVDIQRRGPYRKWVHYHNFLQRNGGTEVQDQVEYQMFGGALLNRLFVKSDVERIFSYRRRVLTQFLEARPEEPGFREDRGSPAERFSISEGGRFRT